MAYYIAFIISFFFVQFMNVEAYKVDGISGAMTYYIYIASFPLGILLGLLNRAENRT